MKKFLMAGFLGFGLVGCSTTMPINYIASPSIRGQGEIAVGRFQYTPAQQGLVKKMNFKSHLLRLEQCICLIMLMHC